MTPEQRDRLAAAVDRLGRALDTVSLDHESVVELDALARICEEAALPEEAARVRRWIPEVARETWLATRRQ